MGALFGYLLLVMILAAPIAWITKHGGDRRMSITLSVIVLAYFIVAIGMVVSNGTNGQTVLSRDARDDYKEQTVEIMDNMA